ncbi:hypothetical protein N7540_011515 [Penicillium herquei]|nr:hypothetical protein N7540_011515 [Penicillium herquei]
MTDIQECLDFIDLLGEEYKDEDRITLIDENPDIIFQTPSMALWAQSTSGERQINLGLPSLKAWLKNLATYGPGRAERYEDIIYTIVKRQQLIISKEEPYGRSPTPFSNLE